MDWRTGVLAVAVLAAACGGTSASPAAPSPTVSLPDGNYQLAVYASGFSCLMVTYTQGSAPASSAQVPVWVGVDGDHWQITSRDAATGSIVITLTRNGTGVSGTATGTLTPSGVSVTLQHQLNGNPNGSAEGIVGSVAGTVNYASAGGTAFCSTNLWSLTRK